MADFSMDSRFTIPPPLFGLLRTKFFCVSKKYQDLIKLRKQNFSTILDKIKVFQEIFVYQDRGKMFQVLHELTSFCMTWQGVSSFVLVIYTASFY